MLDTYHQEKLALPPERRKKYLQSFLIDSAKMDPYFLDGLIQFLKQSNLREREYNDDHEFLLHFARAECAHETLLQHLPITLPNGNVVMLPSDLYFIFEATSLADAACLGALGDHLIGQQTRTDPVGVHRVGANAETPIFQRILPRQE